MNTSNDRTTGLRRLVAVLFVVAMVATACGSSSDTISLGDDAFSPSIEGGDVDSSAQGDVVNFTYDTFDGERAEFSDLPDGPVVLNFFASWCPTCISELPDFQTVSENFADEVTFLGLATQDRSENSVQLVADTGLTYPVGRDQNGSIFTVFGGLAMPTTVFLDADHRVVRVHSGVFDVESLTETINSDLLS